MAAKHVISDENETQRLATLALYDVMDTSAEPEFDDIVFLASEFCQTPVALVSLVERDRQWFKARIGFEACETPIEQSVCQHALASTDLLIIPDLELDPRTKDNTLVTEEPRIRFYAGAPLVVASGVVIGTLCVIDQTPRPEGLTETQKKGLSALARQVVVLLEMRRISQRKDDLFRRQKQISSAVRAVANASIAAQEAGQIGIFELDVASGEMAVSAEFCRIFRMPVADRYPATTFEAMVVEEDRGVESNDQRRSDGTASLSVEYRIRTPEGGIRWIARRASFSQSGDGKPQKMIGTVQDVTEQRQAAARVRAMVELGDRLRNFDDVSTMAFDAATLLAEALGATRAGFGIVDPLRETVIMQPDWRAPGVMSLAGLHHFRSYGSFIEDLKRGETVLIGDVTTDPRTRDNAQSLTDIGIRVLINVPIFDKGKFDLVVFAHYDEPHEWTDDEIDFVRSFGDRIQTAIGRWRAEGEQDILNRELSHRLKNTMSMVQAIASQTLRSVPQRQPVESFERRLHALSSAHDILLQQNWGGACVVEIVTSALEKVGMLERTDISGAETMFGPKATLSLTLLLHELATNALKYGAFSNDTGRVAIDWTVEGEDETAVFHFTWREVGGPPVTEPDTKGFGSKLIRMGLIGTGGVTTRYTSSGLSLEMQASLPQLQQAS